MQAEDREERQQMNSTSVCSLLPRCKSKEAASARQHEANQTAGAEQEQPRTAGAAERERRAKSGRERQLTVPAVQVDPLEEELVVRLGNANAG